MFFIYLPAYLLWFKKLLVWNFFKPVWFVFSIVQDYVNEYNTIAAKKSNQFEIFQTKTTTMILETEIL